MGMLVMARAVNTSLICRRPDNHAIRHTKKKRSVLTTAVAVGAKETSLAQGEKLVERGVFVKLHLAVAVLVEDTNKLPSSVVAEREASESAAGNLVHGNGAAAVQVDALEPSRYLHKTVSKNLFLLAHAATHLGPLVGLNHVVVLGKPALEEGRRGGT